MTIQLTPELEKLVEERIASGQFTSREAVLIHAVELLARQSRPSSALTAKERAEQLEVFFAEVDRDARDAGGLCAVALVSRSTSHGRAPTL